MTANKVTQRLECIVCSRDIWHGIPLREADAKLLARYHALQHSKQPITAKDFG